MSAPGTFSESWYRIAGHRVALRPHVIVRRQYFRGERYYVLHDPFSNQFFRLRPAAYEFVARLELNRTVESVLNECLETNPEEAPGQEQVLRLLGQLHAGNLLHSDLPPDTAKMFERHEKRRVREVHNQWLNLLYARFPLFDPDRLLQRLLPALRAIFSIPGAILWLAVVLAGVKVVVDHAGEFTASSLDALAPDRLLVLYAATVLAKVVHEFGHACACRRLGGEVHVMGVMLMIFTPMPYVDTTSSWSLRSRWARALVGAAGMIAELFLAALAAFVWAATGEGVLHALAFNVILVASVSTLLFNLNPLLRFDGYYILSDLLEIPNLQMRAMRQLQHWVERYAFGLKKSAPGARTTREAAWLGVYGLASLSYRLLVSALILLFIAGKYLLLGLVLAVTGACAWLLLPLWRGVKYLAASPALARQRKRAVAVSCGALAAVLALLFFVPAGNDFRAPGVIEAGEYSMINAATAGRVVELLAPPGAQVEKDQPLLRLENPELTFEIAEAQAKATEAAAMRDRAVAESIADLDPIDSRIAAVTSLLAQLHAQQDALIIRAPHPGLWHAPDIAASLGTWVPRGMELGHVLGVGTFRFSAVVSQEEASRLFDGDLRRSEVRLHGQADRPLAVTDRTIIPAERRKLPSAALGRLAGGEVAVAPDKTGREAREGFFEVRATIRGDATLTHGVSGTIRFELPSEPVAVQWIRKLRQLLQKRFGV
jgi:putative peptide zinc metalloprotease protein